MQNESRWDAETTRRERAARNRDADAFSATEIDHKIGNCAAMLLSMAERIKVMTDDYDRANTNKEPMKRFNRVDFVLRAAANELSKVIEQEEPNTDNTGGEA